MIKRFTGVKYVPQDFRLLNHCLRCGKAGNIADESLCEKCQAENVPNCDMCEIPLRNGTYKFYTYDIKEDHRGTETEFKASKEFVREFEYEMEFSNPLNTDTLCSDCIGWRKNIKNKCRGCEKSFVNTKANYKENGNFCEKCSSSPIVENEETTDDRLEGEGVCHSSHSHQRV